MAKSKGDRITSCTIIWNSADDTLCVVTKVLQTEIQVRSYNNGKLIGGRIWPMSEQQKQELYAVLYNCLEDWTCCDNEVAESDNDHWQFKICNHKGCVREVYGTNEPPHGTEIKSILSGIIGEDNCCFF